MTMPGIATRWAVVRLRFAGPTASMYYRDSRRRSRHFSWDWRLVRPPGIYPTTSELAGLTTLLESLMHGLPPGRTGPHNTGPVPVAVFLGAPPLPGLDELDEFQRLIGPIELDRIQLARLSGKSVHRARFDLPFRVLGLGPVASAALEGFRSAGWYGQSVDVQEFGFVIDQDDHRDALLGGLPRDIVLVDSPEGVHTIRRQPIARRPRLIILLDDRGERFDDLPLPSGVALLRVRPGPSREVGKFIKAFFYGLIHDLPLHESLKAAIREVRPAFRAILVADPKSNESLRIRDALLQIKRRSDRWEMSLPELNVDPFLMRLAETEGVDPHAIRHFRSHFNRTANRNIIEPLGEMRGWTRDVRSLPQNFAMFEQEAEGLVPLASLHATSLRLAGLEAGVREDALRIGQDPSVRALLREHQNRVFDVSVERLDTEPILTSVASSSTLAAGRVYQLRVHIGNRAEDSIVTGAAPPLDPLLPDDESGHELEVAVQGKDFKVLSASVRTLQLPPLGASEPVYFRVRTPRIPMKAELRLYLYYRNHLIQSWLLRAAVEMAEFVFSDGQGVVCSMEFTRTERFADLDERKERSFSIGANHSQGAGTHNLFLKGLHAGEEVTLNPLAFGPQVASFQSLLHSAIADPATGNARQYPMTIPGQPASLEAADFLRSFARQGSTLHHGLFARADAKMRDALHKLRDNDNETIQVIRFDPTYVFPWLLIYDYLLPDEVSGQPPAPVCLGVGVDVNGVVTRCPHTHADRVFCVNGFWGVRHQLEEMFGQGKNTDSTIIRAPRDGIRVVADATLADGRGLLQRLQSAFPTDVTEGPHDQVPLLEILWKEPPERPSILIVLGHIDTEDIANQPTGLRLVLRPNASWLTCERIAERTEPRWGQPRTIVLMMGCESGAITAETINNFTTAWDSAGAGAIIGAEAIIDSALASRLAETVTADLWSGKSLGVSMTEFRRTLMHQGNPTALVFHAIGDLDLTLQ
jgi:hypothetical protein